MLHSFFFYTWDSRFIAKIFVKPPKILKKSIKPGHKTHVAKIMRDIYLKLFVQILAFEEFEGFFGKVSMTKVNLFCINLQYVGFNWIQIPFFELQITK